MKKVLILFVVVQSILSGCCWFKPVKLAKFV